MTTTLDLALARYAVVHKQWSDLASGNSPVLGPFLAGWYWRDMGCELPPREQIKDFKDSFGKGWAEADDFVEILSRTAPTTHTIDKDEEEWWEYTKYP